MVDRINTTLADAERNPDSGRGLGSSSDLYSRTGRVARRVAAAATLLIGVCAAGTPAFANNYGENPGWQFETTADQANLAAVQDLIQKKQNGGYAPPSYTTNYYTTNTSTTSSTSIGHQTNCTVSASAVGNSGGSSAVASSPSTLGSAATSLANSNSNTNQPGGYAPGASTLSGTQSNSGTLGATVNGSTTVSAAGGNYQALNSTQTNSAGQNAVIKASTACAYGALN